MLKFTSVLGFLLAAGICAGQESPKKTPIVPGGRSGPNFSPGIKFGDTLYVSSYIGADPATRKAPEKFEDEMKAALANVHRVLEAGGMDFADVVQVTIYLTDMELFDRMNAVYRETFKDPKPARTTVPGVRLADSGAGAHIQITVTARK